MFTFDITCIVFIESGEDGLSTERTVMWLQGRNSMHSFRLPRFRCSFPACAVRINARAYFLQVSHHNRVRTRKATNIRWEATQKVMAATFTRLCQTESSNACGSRY
jgi:hypothetical protein